MSTRSPLRGVALASLVLLAASSSPRATQACAVAVPGELAPALKIDREQAALLYDDATQTEHFIRTANFSNVQGPFAFLVPTPTRPTLGEAPGEYLSVLAGQAEPEHRTEVRRPLRPLFGCFHAMLLTTRSAPVESAVPAPQSAAVRVLEQTPVAGLDATVLAAEDPAALAAWLGEHGFGQRPGLTQWLAPYVAARWTVTAFRYAATEPDARMLTSRAVRLSFRTEQPVYPYREPQDARHDAGDTRSLRVMLLARQRRTGRLGDAAWPAPVRVSYRLPPTLGRSLWTMLAGSAPDFDPWFTQQEDSTVRRGDVDVRFPPDEGPAVPRQVLTVIQEEPRELFLPVELLALAGAGVGLALRRRRKRA